MEKKLVLTAVGDVFLGGSVRLSGLDPVESDERAAKRVLDKILPYFHTADINFCNLEAALAGRGTLQAGRSVAFKSYPSMVEVLKKAKIDFVSLANNHSMDYGWDALSETTDILRKNGIGFAGAGENIFEARRPAMIKKKGITIGLLSYCTNLNAPFDFQATQEKPGLAAVRVSSFFPPPHTNQEDLEALREDVEKCRSLVDFLIVSCHWGVSDKGSHTIALHQTAIAHHAIDAGADLILGHHPHAVQGVEIYKNKVICYSLGNFVFPLAGFPRETMLFQCKISPHKIHETRFWPALVSREEPAEVLPIDRGKGAEIVSLMRKLCLQLGTTLTQKKEDGVVLEGGNDASK